MQFVSTLSTNLAKMYGSVLVQVTSISSGSVLVGTSVSFLDSVSGGSNAAAYEQLLSSSSASNIYGTYAASVDVSTITSSKTSTPSTGKGLASQRIHKQCCLLIHDVKCVSCTAFAGFTMYVLFHTSIVCCHARHAQLTANTHLLAGSSTSDATKACNAALKHSIVAVLACAIILF